MTIGATESSREILNAAAGHRSLIYPGFAPGVALLTLGMCVSIVLLGLTMPYYNKAASDMVSVYEGLLYNSHLPQEFVVYPAVLDRVLLGWWLSALKGLGLISISRLEELKPLSDIKAYDAQWQMLVQAGRVYSLLTGIACVMSIVGLVYRWLGVWQIAVLSGVAFAFSSGVALGFRILRPEMLTATLTFDALLVTLVCAKQRDVRWRLLGLVLAGLLIALAVLEKVQSVIPAFALLPLAWALGTYSPPETRNRIIWRWAAVLTVMAALAIWPAVIVIQQGIAGMAGSKFTEVLYRPLMSGLSGHYQLIGAAVVVAAMGAYAAIWRVSMEETLAGIAAFGLGLASGIDVLYLQPSADAIIAVANPLEHLQGLAAGSGSLLLSQTPGAIFSTLLSSVGRALAIHTFVLAPMHRPTLLIEWLALYGMVHALRNGRQLLALQIFLLLGCAIAEDTLFSLRQVKVYYLPYSDLPIVLAGALALTQFADRLTTPRFERAAAVLMVFYVVWGHAQPALAVYSHHDKGKVCAIVVQFTKRITIPYCAGNGIPAAGAHGLDDN